LSSVRIVGLSAAVNQAQLACPGDNNNIGEHFWGLKYEEAAGRK
jgi:hypothetical protein